MNVRNLVVALTVGLVGFGTAAAVAQQGGDEPLVPGGDVAQVTAVEPAAEDAAAVLEQDRGAADALPSAAAAAFDEQAMLGMNPGLSRRAIAEPSSSLYVIPANGHVCAALAFGERANVSCAATDDLAAGDAAPATTLLEGGVIAIYGIVPDGVGEVTVHSDAPGSGVAEVTDNGYMAVVPEGTRLESVDYVGPSGEVSFPIYDPSAP